MKGKESSNATPAPAVVRAGAVLRELASADSRVVSLSDLSRALGLPKSSLASICAALVDAGLARRTSGGYELGWQLVELGGAYLERRQIIKSFYEACQELPTASYETVQLAIIDDVDVIYLARHDGQQAIRLTSEIGRKLAASHTALGKATLAMLDDEEIAQRYRSRAFKTPTRNSISRYEKLQEEINEIRLSGYATDDEESSEGVICYGVAVPGFAFGDYMCGISTTLLKTRATPKLRDALVDDLKQLVDHLGNPFRSESELLLSSSRIKQ